MQVWKKVNVLKVCICYTELHQNLQTCRECKYKHILPQHCHKINGLLAQTQAKLDSRPTGKCIRYLNYVPYTPGPLEISKKSKYILLNPVKAHVNMSASRHRPEFCLSHFPCPTAPTRDNKSTAPVKS